MASGLQTSLSSSVNEATISEESKDLINMPSLSGSPLQVASQFSPNQPSQIQPPPSQQHQAQQPIQSAWNVYQTGFNSTIPQQVLSPQSQQQYGGMPPLQSNTQVPPSTNNLPLMGIIPPVAPTSTHNVMMQSLPAQLGLQAGLSSINVNPNQPQTSNQPYFKRKSPYPAVVFSHMSDSDKVLQALVLDWLYRKRYVQTADCFATETDMSMELCRSIVDILSMVSQQLPNFNTTPQTLATGSQVVSRGFLNSWWTPFWDLFYTRTLSSGSSPGPITGIPPGTSSSTNAGTNVQATSQQPTLQSAPMKLTPLAIRQLQDFSSRDPTTLTPDEVRLYQQLAYRYALQMQPQQQPLIPAVYPQQQFQAQQTASADPSSKRGKLPLPSQQQSDSFVNETSGISMSPNPRIISSNQSFSQQPQPGQLKHQPQLNMQWLSRQPAQLQRQILSSLQTGQFPVNLINPTGLAYSPEMSGQNFQPIQQPIPQQPYQLNQTIVDSSSDPIQTLFDASELLVGPTGSGNVRMNNGVAPAGKSPIVSPSDFGSGPNLLKIAPSPGSGVNSKRSRRPSELSPSPSPLPLSDYPRDGNFQPQRKQLRPKKDPNPAMPVQEDPDLFFNLEDHINPQLPTEHHISQLPLLNDVGVLGEHQGKAVTCSFSFDGCLLASGGHDRKIKIWSISQSQSTFQFLGCLPIDHSQPITQVRFSPGSKRYLASSSFDKTVHIWDLGEDGSPPPLELPSAPAVVFSKHEAPVFSIDFAPPKDEQAADVVCSCDSDGVLLTWRISSFESVYSFQFSTQDTAAVSVRQIKFQVAQSTTPLLAVANGVQVDLYNYLSNQIVGTINTEHTKPVVSLCWGDTQLSSLLGLATSDALSVWNVDSEGHFKCLTTFPLQGDKITCCTFMRDPYGTMLLGSPSEEAASKAKSPKLLSSESKRSKLLISKYLVFGTYRLIYLCKLNVTFDSNGEIKMAEEEEGNKIRTHRMSSTEAHSGLVASISITRKGPLFLSSSGHDSQVKLWTLSRREEKTGVDKVSNNGKSNTENFDPNTFVLDILDPNPPTLNLSPYLDSSTLSATTSTTINSPQTSYFNDHVGEPIPGDGHLPYLGA